jgi:hypothetical protein
MSLSCAFMHLSLSRAGREQPADVVGDGHRLERPVGRPQIVAKQEARPRPASVRAQFVGTHLKQGDALQGR